MTLLWEPCWWLILALILVKPLRGTWDIEIISLLTQAWENQLHNWNIWRSRRIQDGCGMKHQSHLSLFFRLFPNLVSTKFGRWSLTSPSVLWSALQRLCWPAFWRQSPSLIWSLRSNRDELFSCHVEARRGNQTWMAGKAFVKGHLEQNLWIGDNWRYCQCTCLITRGYPHVPTLIVKPRISHWQGVWQGWMCCISRVGCRSAPWTCCWLNASYYCCLVYFYPTWVHLNYTFS